MFRKVESCSDSSITRRHWMPAAAVRDCCSPACDLKFTSFHRKHHCRCCGNIFCTACASYSMPLDPATAQITTNGIWAKVCILCYEMGIEDGFEQPDGSDASDDSDGDADHAPPESLEDAVFRRKPAFLRSVSENSDIQVKVKQNKIPRTSPASGTGTPGGVSSSVSLSETSLEDNGPSQSAAVQVDKTADVTVAGSDKEVSDLPGGWQPGKVNVDVLLLLEGAKSVLEMNSTDDEQHQQDNILENSVFELGADSGKNIIVENSVTEVGAVSEDGIVFTEDTSLSPTDIESKTGMDSGALENEESEGQGAEPKLQLFSPPVTTPSGGKSPGGRSRLGLQRGASLSWAEPLEIPGLAVSGEGVKLDIATGDEGNPRMSNWESKANESKGGRKWEKVWEGMLTRNSRSRGSGSRSRRFKKSDELPVSFGMPVGLWNLTPEQTLDSPASVLDRPPGGSPSTDAEMSTSQIGYSDGDSLLASTRSTSFRSEYFEDMPDLRSMRSRSMQSDDSGANGLEEPGDPGPGLSTLGRRLSFGGNWEQDGGTSGRSQNFRLSLLQSPWEPRVSERLRELHDLWEQRIRKKYVTPLVRSKPVKLNVHGLQVKSDGTPRMFAVPPTSPDDIPMHSFYPSPSGLYRSRTLSPRVASAHRTLKSAMFEKDGLPSPGPTTARVPLVPTVSLSAGMAVNREATGGNALEFERSRSEGSGGNNRSSSFSASESISEEGNFPWSKSEAERIAFSERVANEANESEGITLMTRFDDAVESSKDGETNGNVPAGEAEEDKNKRKGTGGVIRWTVADVCSWLQKDVLFDGERVSEHVEAFKKAEVGGLQLLGLHREDPACESMTDSDWSTFKAARWRLLTTDLGPAVPKLTVSIPDSHPLSSHKPDKPPHLSSQTTSASHSPYSPRSPELSDSALWSPVGQPEVESNPLDVLGNGNWLWSLVNPMKTEQNDLQTTAVMMEVQTLRGEMSAAEEREASLNAKLAHLDDALRNGQIAEYLSTRTRWTAMPGEVPLPEDLDVDDWLPRFVVLQGPTLSCFLKATDLKPQATVNLERAVEAGPMSAKEHSAGNSDGQWLAFYVLTEQGMRLECSTKNRLKFELWLSSVQEAMGRHVAMTRPMST